MTREEIEELKGLAASMGLYDDKNPCISELVQKAYEDGKKDGYVRAKIEQEPSGDAIDRKLVCAFIDGLISDDREREKGLEYIRHMPPVNPLSKDYNTIYYTPQPKTAHWIIHPKGIYAHLICDNCLSNAPYDCRTNYCPNCGFRMIEPQKSEG